MTRRLPGEDPRGVERAAGKGVAGKAAVCFGDARARNIVILIALLVILISSLATVRKFSDGAEASSLPAEPKVWLESGPDPVLEEPMSEPTLEARRAPREGRIEAAALRGVFTNQHDTITFVPSWKAGRWAGFATVSGMDTQWWYTVHQGQVVMYLANYEQVREYEIVTPDELRAGARRLHKQPPVQ